MSASTRDHQDPLRPPPSFAMQGASAADVRGIPGARPPLRILYVEDNDDVRETTGLLLEGPGREVIALSTGEQAQALMREGGCDLLFTDVNLPGISGEDLARDLLAREPEHWVVLCSGRPLGPDVRGWGPHVRVLPKLFRLEELEALMADVARDLASRDGHQ